MSLRSVAICIATYRRPDGLTRLLLALERLEYRDDAPEVVAVVVDNDADRSAADVCDRVRPDLRLPVEYLVEPKRGIANVRNAAVEHVAGRFPFLAFIDDDEVPDPGWLDELLRAQRNHDADVVTGPVVTEFIAEPPSWVRTGRYFDRPQRRTGECVDRAFTGNVLFRTAVFREPALRFDERLGLVGGEDTHLSQRIVRAGRRIVWADDAVVTEFVPPTRTTVKWLLRRAFRTGTSLSFCDRDIVGTFGVVAGAIAKGLFWMARGAVELPFSFLFGFHRAVRRLQWVAFGLGRLTGVAGFKYAEYKTTDGT